MTVTIHLKSGVKQTYLETAVMDDVERQTISRTRRWKGAGKHQ